MPSRSLNKLNLNLEPGRDLGTAPAGFTDVKQDLDAVVQQLLLQSNDLTVVEAAGGGSGGPDGTEFQMFRTRVENNGGVLQVTTTSSLDLNASFPATASPFVSGINGASSSRVTLANGPIASTAFVNGYLFPSDSALSPALILDTAALTDSLFAGVFNLFSNSPSANKGIPVGHTETINGVSRRRLYVFFNGPSGGNFLPSGLSAGQFVTFDFMGYLPAAS